MGLRKKIIKNKDEGFELFPEKITCAIFRRLCFFSKKMERICVLNETLTTRNFKILSVDWFNVKKFLLFYNQSTI